MCINVQLQYDYLLRSLHLLAPVRQLFVICRSWACSPHLVVGCTLLNVTGKNTGREAGKDAGKGRAILTSLHASLHVYCPGLLYWFPRLVLCLPCLEVCMLLDSDCLLFMYRITTRLCYYVIFISWAPYSTTPTQIGYLVILI